MSQSGYMPCWVGYDDVQITCTVKDLINILEKYPSDMKVMTTKERMAHLVAEDCIYESIWGILFISCDGERYKNEFKKG